MKLEYTAHPQEPRIQDTIMSELTRLRGLSLYHSASRYVKVTDDLKLSFPADLCRENGCFKASRNWLRVSVLLRGVLTTVSYPLRLDGDGITDFRECYPISAEELEASLHHHRPRKPLPFPLGDEKSPVVVLEYEHVALGSDRTHAEWTTPARPAAAINTMLKRIGVDPLVTAESNALLASVDELLLQYATRVEWLDEKPSRIYSTDSTNHYTSCMSGESEDWFELYDSFYNDGRLRMIGIFRGDTRVGRALVWTGENPADLYLDRVYAPGNRTTFDPGIVKELKAFCAAEGIAKTCFQQTAEWFGVAMVPKLKLRVPRERGPEWFDRVPYVDSMRYFGRNGWLYSYEPRNVGGFRTMDSTNGRYSGDDDDDEANDRTYVDGGPGSGDYHDEEDCCWVEHLGETWLREYCTYSDHLDQYIPDSRSVETYDHHLIWQDDAIELFDGEWAEDDDSDLFQLSDGTYAINGHHTIVTMHDGEVMVDDGDLDWTTTADGENALREDCVEVDGVWYLQGSEPQPEEEEEETETVA